MDDHGQGSQLLLRHAAALPAQQGVAQRWRCASCTRATRVAVGNELQGRHHGGEGQGAGERRQKHGHPHRVGQGGEAHAHGAGRRRGSQGIARHAADKHRRYAGVRRAARGRHDDQGSITVVGHDGGGCTCGSSVPDLGKGIGAPGVVEARA